MARNRTKHEAAQVVVEQTATEASATEPRILPDLTVTDEQEAAAEAEIAEQIALPHSVVKRAYKVKYRDRARANGERGKAAKRSAWDWLAQQLARETLTKDHKLKVEAFCDLLEANGIDKPLERWPNQSKGWEGRLRMTGRLALQKIVAETGLLQLANGDYLEAPEEWIATYLR